MADTEIVAMEKAARALTGQLTRPTAHLHRIFTEPGSEVEASESRWWM